MHFQSDEVVSNERLLSWYVSVMYLGVAGTPVPWSSATLLYM